MDYKLEICADSIESAINAQTGGADRIELCTNLQEGGTTPGAGLISAVRNNLSIALHVLIRPRGGDFLYKDIEYDIMRREIEFCGENGVDGIVLGILRTDGSIDIERTAKLIESAKPMSATFHRAFDLCKDPLKSLEDIITTGADRLLTSGQMNKAVDGIELINKLIIKAQLRIIIMPGSGINDTNIGRIANGTGAKEFHLTGRKTIDSEMIFRKAGIALGGEGGQNEFTLKVANPLMIRQIINILNLS